MVQTSIVHSFIAPRTLLLVKSSSDTDLTGEWSVITGRGIRSTASVQKTARTGQDVTIKLKADFMLLNRAKEEVKLLGGAASG
jgi:hypothetical protein